MLYDLLVRPIVFRGVTCSILLIVFACVNEQEDTPNEIDEPKQEVKNFESFPQTEYEDITILSDSIVFGAPASIEYIDSTLVFRDAQGPPFVHAYRLRDGKLVSFGEQGQGPGEFMGVWEVDNISREQFRIFDLSQRRVSRCSLDSLFKSDKNICKPEISLKGEGGTPVRVDMSMGSVILATGIYDKRIAFYSTKGGDIIKKVGNIPENVDILSDISTIKRNRAYEAVISADTSSSSVITAAIYSDRLDIYNMNGSLKNITTGPLGFVPKMRTLPSGRLSPIPSTKTAYLDLQIDNDHIYALYSGLTDSESDNDNKSGHKSIFVFDKNGNPERRINIRNHRLLSITPGPAGDRIYCAIIYPKPAIGYIDLT